MTARVDDMKRDHSPVTLNTRRIHCNVKCINQTVDDAHAETTMEAVSIMQRWIDVIVAYGSDIWCDAVWATNEYEALVVAHWNWEGASVYIA